MNRENRDMLNYIENKIKTFKKNGCNEEDFLQWKKKEFF